MTCDSKVLIVMITIDVLLRVHLPFCLILNVVSNFIVFVVDSTPIRIFCVVLLFSPKQLIFDKNRQGVSETSQFSFDEI